MEFKGGDKMVEKHPFELYIKKVGKSFTDAGIEGEFTLAVEFENRDDSLELNFGGESKFSIKDNWITLIESTGGRTTQIFVHHFINLDKVQHIQEI